MIIIDDEANPPGERSPLKGPGNSQTSPIDAAAPPPPYVAAAPLSPTQQSYQSITRPSYSTVPLISPPRPRRSVTKRFLKAFAYALLVLFLWSMFLQTLEMLATRRYNRRQPHAPKPKNPRNHVHNGVDWIIEMHKRLKTPRTPSNDCPCLPTAGDSTPGRVLPIQYPPLVHVEEPTPPAALTFNLELPTATQEAEWELPQS
ncbi:hypothetical protein NLJ89_g5549 [Agrocybe chaxingu]|uniref:Uncharacterized protein n=1 Tax=Agrocybe chaxingu TaxID=84603 RepID=A0A9W8K846_9AGAR|nr:hypothetical protein NLJ89_g5549 [Agrocybe chaxingu]